MNCGICGKNVDSFNERSKSAPFTIAGSDYRVCGSCVSSAGSSDQAEAKLKEQLGLTEEKIKETKELAAKFDSMIMATTSTLQDILIKKYIGIVGAQTVQGINVFKDAFAGIRNVVGGRSQTLQYSMKKMREEALLELKEEAFKIGANAVVGISLDFDEYSEGMMMLSVSGTAVVI